MTSNHGNTATPATAQAADLALLAHRAEAARALADIGHSLALNLNCDRPRPAPLAGLELPASPRNLQGLLAALADLASEIEAMTGRLADAETLGRLRWIPAEAEEAQP